MRKINVLIKTKVMVLFISLKNKYKGFVSEKNALADLCIITQLMNGVVW